MSENLLIWNFSSFTLFSRAIYYDVITREQTPNFTVDLTDACVV